MPRERRVSYFSSWKSIEIMAALPLLTALLLSATSAQPAPASIDVRVGIVAYEDFHQEYAEFEQLFAEIARREPNMHFRLAVGSYGEVLHWIDSQQIDLAILTPGVFAGLLVAEGHVWDDAHVPVPGDRAITGRPVAVGLDRSPRRGVL